MNTEIVPLIHQVAVDADVSLIDVNGALSGHADYFPDNVHPNAVGARLIATTMAAAL